jgi:hypothetical protein
VRSWTYTPATLDGKPVASTLTINIVYDPGSLGADNIPLPPPSQVQPISTKDPAFFPAQLNTATFAPYPAKAKAQGEVDGLERRFAGLLVVTMAITVF